MVFVECVSEAEGLQGGRADTGVWIWSTGVDQDPWRVWNSFPGLRSLEFCFFHLALCCQEVNMLGNCIHYPFFYRESPSAFLCLDSPVELPSPHMLLLWKAILWSITQCFLFLFPRHYLSRCTKQTCLGHWSSCVQSWNSSRCGQRWCRCSLQPLSTWRTVPSPEFSCWSSLPHFPNSHQVSSFALLGAKL